MNKRKLGRTGLETGPLIFGGNVFGWTADEAMSFKLLDAFVDAGLNVIDTAHGCAATAAESAGRASAPRSGARPRPWPERPGPWNSWAPRPPCAARCVPA